MNEGYLIHYGTPRHSGRYPYGSGENPFQGMPKYERSQKLKARSAELKKLAESSDNKEEAAKYTKKAEKLAAKYAKLQNKVEYQYASDYAKRLNTAKSASDKVFNKSISKIADLAESRKLLSAKSLAEAGLATSSLLSYEILRSKAVKDIPDHTNYALEIVNGEYRVRNKYDAAGVNTKPATNFIKGDYTTKSLKGRINLVSTLAKTGLDVYDTVRTNKNYSSKKQTADAKAKAEEKASERINKAEAKAITIKAKAEAAKISGNGNPNNGNAKAIVKKSVNAARSSIKSAAALTTVISTLRKSKSSDTKVDKFINNFGNVLAVAVPVSSIVKSVTDNV